MKAIETTYKGCRFRSRLEARWAVWLDACGVRWLYEPQGFDLDGKAYLPDFFLPFPSPVSVGGDPPPASRVAWGAPQAYWLEIKPTTPTDEERELLCLLARGTGHHAYCFAGQPWPGEFRVYQALCQGGWHDVTAGGERLDRELADLCQEHNGYLPAADPTGPIRYALHAIGCNVAEGDWDRMALAFRRARSARFEHGETGAAR